MIITVALLASCSREAEPVAEPSLYADTPEEMEALLAADSVRPDHMKTVEAIWSYYTIAGEYRSLISHAKPVYDRAGKSGDGKLQVYAGVYLGSSCLNMDMPDSMFYYFNAVTPIATELELAAPLSAIYNSLAVYALKSEMDFTKALEYFQMAMDEAKKNDDQLNYNVIQGNVAMAYYHRNDPAGLPYALDVYRGGKDNDDPYMIFNGAIICARMYYLQGDYGKALEYAEQALPLVARHKRETAGYALYADILAGMGEGAKAEQYYYKAFEFVDEAEAVAAVSAYLGYGNFLLEERRYAKARDIFAKGIALAEDKNNKESRHSLYLGLSKAQQGLGMETEALESYKLYHAQSDSLFNVEKERAFNRLNMKYEAEKYESEIRVRELKLERESRKTQIIAFTLVVILLVLGMIYILYRRKNRMYHELVKRHQESLQKEKLRKPEVHEKAGVADVNKAEGLFASLEEMMRSGRIYADKDVSLEKLAEMLDTNRSYISRIVNQYAGVSFSNYVNSYRMEEAVAVLSDPANDIPLKALSDNLGYNSISSFYRSFQKETGVPPSKYREEVKKLNRKRAII